MCLVVNFEKLLSINYSSTLTFYTRNFIACCTKSSLWTICMEGENKKKVFKGSFFSEKNTSIWCQKIDFFSNPPDKMRTKLNLIDVKIE